MKRFAALIPLLGLAFVAGCSEPMGPASNDDLAVSYAKGDNGGKGSPHFTDETVCTFDENSGTLGCDYQLGGLSANSSGVGTLAGNLILTYRCNIPFISDPYVTSERFAVDFYYYTDRKGNAKGYVEGSPTVGAICLVGTPYNILYSINEYASLITVPYLTPGTWSLVGLSTTPKSVINPVFYSGAWIPPLPVL